MSGTSGRPTRPAGPISREYTSPLRFSIPSDFAASRQVQLQILGDVQRLGYSERASHAIRLALEEALINAIKHGNKLDPHKHVRIDARINPRRAEFVIEDEGAGFERAKVPDPTADENLCKICGRGIFLIESYMNKVQWSHGGRRLRMVKLNRDAE
jgi:serine/threonine-protein kinase RsbW